EAGTVSHTCSNLGSVGATGKRGSPHPSMPRVGRKHSLDLSLQRSNIGQESGTRVGLVDQLLCKTIGCRGEGTTELLVYRAPLLFWPLDKPVVLFNRLPTRPPLPGRDVQPIPDVRHGDREDQLRQVQPRRSEVWPHSRFRQGPDPSGHSAG